MMRRIGLTIVLGSLAAVVGCGGGGSGAYVWSGTGTPTITFSSIPAIGSYARLKGTISGGINPNQLAIAVYINVAGGWWTKPYADAPLTVPNADGSWECDVTTGGIDQDAIEFLAFLVYRTTTVPVDLGDTNKPAIASALASADAVR